MDINWSQINIKDPVGSVIGGVELRSTIAPPSAFPPAAVKAMFDGQSPPANTVQNRILKLLKPTAIVTSPTLGVITVAPFGVATPDEWESTRMNIYAMAFAVVAVIFTAGVLVGRRRSKKSKLGAQAAGGLGLPPGSELETHVRTLSRDVLARDLRALERAAARASPFDADASVREHAANTYAAELHRRQLQGGN